MFCYIQIKRVLPANENNSDYSVLYYSRPRLHPSCAIKLSCQDPLIRSHFIPEALSEDYWRNWTLSLFTHSSLNSSLWLMSEHRPSRIQGSTIFYCLSSFLGWSWCWLYKPCKPRGRVSYRKVASVHGVQCYAYPRRPPVSGSGTCIHDFVYMCQPPQYGNAY